MPLYKGEAHSPVTFDTAGLVVLGCNIHDEMVGYIFVTDSPYFAKTDADGNAEIPDVPAGHYRLDVWGPRVADRGETLVREVTLAECGRGRRRVAIAAPPATASVARDPGTSTGTTEMRCARAVAIVLLLGSHALTCHAGDRLEVQGELDLRLVDSDASPSFLEGGLGRQRFDSDHDGLRLGRATFDATAANHRHRDRARRRRHVRRRRHERRGPHRGVRRLPAVSQTDRGAGELRGGMFYAPISLENRGPGWTNVYTVSNSAISTWIGEEIRTVGVEGEARWRGQAHGASSDVALVLGLYRQERPGRCARRGAGLRAA